MCVGGGGGGSLSMTLISKFGSFVGYSIFSTTKNWQLVFENYVLHITLIPIPYVKSKQIIII